MASCAVKIYIITGVSFNILGTSNETTCDVPPKTTETLNETTCDVPHKPTELDSNPEDEDADNVALNALSKYHIYNFFTNRIFTCQSNQLPLLIICVIPTNVSVSIIFLL